VLLGPVGDELLARQVGAPGQEDADLDHRNSFEVTVPRRAEAALVTVVATSYLLGVSTRRMEKLVETLDITRLSKSQVSSPAPLMAHQVAEDSGLLASCGCAGPG
jgi:hypothetical protein